MSFSVSSFKLNCRSQVSSGKSRVTSSISSVTLVSACRGEIPDYPGAPTKEIRNATREAFRNMIDLAIELDVDFVVIAGDLYDGDWKSYDTGLVFREQMLRLSAEEIPVFIVLGNHDAASVITKKLSLP